MPHNQRQSQQVSLSRLVSFEIRAPRDRNRLLGHYEPGRRMLRLYHRGETIAIDLGALDVQCQEDKGENDGD